MSSLPEKLKPTLHAVFKNENWYNKIKEMEYLEKNQGKEPKPDTTSTSENPKPTNVITSIPGQLSEVDKRNIKLKAVDFALEVNELADTQTGYTSSKRNKLRMTNPFNDFPNNTPYIMDSASFVYWVYDKIGYPLDMHDMTIRQLPHANKLENLSYIGSNYSPELIELGDLVFFSKDRLVGIYTGHYEFTTFLGKGVDNMAGGISTESFKDGLFADLYEGHVMRIK